MIKKNKDQNHKTYEYDDPQCRKSGKWLERDSNPRPQVYDSRALPTELSSHNATTILIIIYIDKHVNWGNIDFICNFITQKLLHEI